MTLTLAHFPKDASALRRIARPVRDDEFGSEPLLDFAKELAELMMSHGAIGIASTQVLEAPGGAPWQMIALRVDDERFGVFCNPAILQRYGTKSGIEGCISFASVGVPLPAPEMVKLSFRNTKGVEGEVLFEGLRARCAAHECEHLAGKLLIDRMTPMKRGIFLRDVKRHRESIGRMA